MPVFMVTAPDGRKLRITAPEGATEQDAIAYAQRQLGGVAEAPPAPVGPLKVGQAISGGAGASARAAPITQEFNPRTSGADATTQVLTQLLRNPVTAPPLLGTAAGLRLAGRKGGAVQDAARRTIADALSLLSNADSDQELAARFAVPGVKFEDDPRVGRVAVLPDGSRQPLNMPGITGRSVESFVAQALPFLAGPGGVGTGVLSRLGLGALRGAVGGTLREAVEAPLRTAAGGENRPGEAAKDIGVDALMGGVGEAALSPLLQRAAKGLRGLLGKNQWSREAVADALKSEGLPESTIDAVFKAGQQGQDPMAVLRLVEAEQINNPLTPGQVQGDDTVMAQLRALLAQNGDAGGSGAMARQALEGQDAAIAAEAQRIRDVAGVDPNRVGPSGGSDVLGPLDARVALERARTQAAYAKIPEDSVLNPTVFNSREFSPEGRAVVDSIGDILRTNRGGAPATSGQLKRLLDGFRAGKPMPWSEWDNTRRAISELTKSPDGREGAAASQALDLLNRMEEFATQMGGFVSYSNPAANPGALIRDARRTAATGFQLFDRKVPTPTGGETPDAVARLVSGGVQPQAVMDDLLGAGGRLDPKRRGFTEGLQRLAQVSPESFQAVRLEAINRAVEQVLSAPSEKVLEKAVQGLRANKQFLRPLIDESQFNEILRLGRQRAAAIAGRSGSKAPLPTKDFVSKVSSALLYGGGGAAGAGALLGAGPMFGLALAGGGVLGRAYANRANRKMAEALTQPFKAPPTPAVQGVDARLFPPTFLQYLNQDE